jgi:hypothetical protein
MSDYCNPSDTEDLLNWSIAYPVVQSKSLTNTLDFSELDNTAGIKSGLSIGRTNGEVQTKSSDNKMETYLRRTLKSEQDVSLRTKSNKNINNIESKKVNSSKVRNII